MLRKTTAPRIIKNYKYAVYLPPDLPAEFWEQARSMNALWNDLIEERERLIADLRTVREKATAAAASSGKNEENSLAEEKTQAAAQKNVWKEFDRRLVEISRRADWKEKLGDNAREYILESFRTASVRAFRDKGNLRPKPVSLNSVVIPYRFTDGGWQVERVFAGFGRKFHLDPLPPEVFEKHDWQSRRARITRGFYGYGVANKPLPVRVLMHRPLPNGGRLKTVKLIGKFDRLTRLWTWHLLLACQTDPSEEIREVQPAAPLDLGYRRIDDYLRIGYLVDTGGHQYELRLPIMEPPSRKLLNALKSVNRGREHQGLVPLAVAEFYPVTIFDVQAWQEKNDRRLERVKERLTELIEGFAQEKNVFSEEINDLLNRLKLIRRTGLLKLWRLTEEPDSEPARLLHGLLDEWKSQDLENLKKIKATGTHLINKRNKIYENIALWLNGNFGYLVVGKNLSLREVAETAPQIPLDSEQAGIRVGAKYRFFAALYFLQRKLKEKKPDDWLIQNDAPFAAATCYRCRAVCESTKRLKVICPNGHEADQDFQACRNRLRELPEELVVDRCHSPVIIPEHLKKYIVRVE